MSSDQEMYTTPAKESKERAFGDIHAACALFQSLDICSVCLSPCQVPSSSSADSLNDNEKDQSTINLIVKPSVETKCKHHFHQKCLNEAKAMKPECPMCRCPLSPLPDSQATLYPNLMRQAVISAASRGRNAVREAMLRRQMAQAQQAAVQVQ